MKTQKKDTHNQQPKDITALFLIGDDGSSKEAIYQHLSLTSEEEGQ
jgi:hypothetical protein